MKDIQLKVIIPKYTKKEIAIQVQEASEHFLNKNYKLSLQKYKQIQNQDKDNFVFKFQEANCRFLLKDYNTSQKIFKSILQDNQNLPVKHQKKVLNNLLLCYKKTGNKKQQNNLQNQLLSLNKENKNHQIMKLLKNEIVLETYPKHRLKDKVQVQENSNKNVKYIAKNIEQQIPFVQNKNSQSKDQIVKIISSEKIKTNDQIQQTIQDRNDDIQDMYIKFNDSIIQNLCDDVRDFSNSSKKLMRSYESISSIQQTNITQYNLLQKKQNKVHNPFRKQIHYNVLDKEETLQTHYYIAENFSDIYFPILNIKKSNSEILEEAVNSFINSMYEDCLNRLDKLDVQQSDIKIDLLKFQCYLKKGKLCKIQNKFDLLNMEYFVQNKDFLFFLVEYFIKIEYYNQALNTIEYIKNLYHKNQLQNLFYLKIFALYKSGFYSKCLQLITAQKNKKFLQFEAFLNFYLGKFQNLKELVSQFNYKQKIESCCLMYIVYRIAGVQFRNFIVLNIDKISLKNIQILSKIMLSFKDYELALNTYQFIINKMQDEQQIFHLQKGVFWCLLKQKKFDQSLDILLKLKNKHDNFVLYKLLGITYFKLKKYKEAISNLLLFTNHFWHDLQSFYYIAKSYYFLNEQEKCQKYIIKQLQINPFGSKNYFLQGLLDLDQQNYEDSIQSFQLSLNYINFPQKQFYSIRGINYFLMKFGKKINSRQSQKIINYQSYVYYLQKKYQDCLKNLEKFKVKSCVYIINKMLCFSQQKSYQNLYKVLCEIQIQYLEKLQSSFEDAKVLENIIQNYHMLGEKRYQLTKDLNYSIEENTASSNFKKFIKNYQKDKKQIDSTIQKNFNLAFQENQNTKSYIHNHIQKLSDFLKTYFRKVDKVFDMYLKNQQKTIINQQNLIQNYIIKKYDIQNYKLNCKFSKENCTQVVKTLTSLELFSEFKNNILFQTLLKNITSQFFDIQSKDYIEQEFLFFFKLFFDNVLSQKKRAPQIFENALEQLFNIKRQCLILKNTFGFILKICFTGTLPRKNFSIKISCKEEIMYSIYNLKSYNTIYVGIFDFFDLKEQIKIKMQLDETKKNFINIIQFNYDGVKKKLKISNSTVINTCWNYTKLQTIVEYIEYQFQYNQIFLKLNQIITVTFHPIFSYTLKYDFQQLIQFLFLHLKLLFFQNIAKKLLSKTLHKQLQIQSKKQSVWLIFLPRDSMLQLNDTCCKFMVFYLIYYIQHQWPYHF